MSRILKNIIRTIVPNAVVDWLVWKRASGLTGKIGTQLVDEIAAKIDVDQLDAMRKETTIQLDGDPAAAAKYFDTRTWLRKSVGEAVRLGLHRDKGLKLLDIGCGPAWFLAVGTHLGHECAGIDLPLEMARPGDRFAYTKIPEILGCIDRIIRASIEAFTPIPLDGAFDLITCNRICFDGQWQKDAWGVNEWEYFLSDADRIMAPGARLYLQLNAKREIHQKFVYYDRATRDLFASKGKVSNGHILIKKPNSSDNIVSGSSN